MRLVRPLGHETLAERLWSAARAGRLPHALCVEGPAGTGKFALLAWFAAGLLCERGPGEPCLSCGPCKRVQAGGAGGGHADLLVIDPLEEGEEQIRIARIAERSGSADQPASVEAFLALRTAEGGRRPILMREAHRMNHAAQNALLKTLEEPRPGTLLLLETERPDALLATIKSRCVRVRTRGLSDDDTRRVLEGLGVAPERARELVRLAPGSPGEALSAERSGVEPLLALARELLCGERSATSTALRVWEIEASFPGGTPAAQARARASFVLGRLAALVGDLARASEGLRPAVPAHGPLVAELVTRFATRAGAPPALVSRSLLALVEARGDVARNLAPEAVLERAMLVLGELASVSSSVPGAAAGRRAR